jgi:TRAP-type C4-dicarboxylate transport system permease small subunit
MRSWVENAAGWIRRRSENVIAAMLGVMFTAFVIQIVFRYFLNLPTGWTTELVLVCWLWMVLWGAAFVLTEEEEIRFDILTAALRGRARRALAAIVAVAAIGLLGLSLPGTWKYVTFMAVERSSYLSIRMDWLYSIFVIFIVALIVRYVFRLVRALRGDPDTPAADDGVGA